MTSKIAMARKQDIQIGDSTQIHDHVIKPVSLRTTKTTVSTLAKLKPPPLALELSLIIYLLSNISSSCAIIKKT